MSWNKANYEENVRELEIAKHEKLGALLGLVDAIPACGRASRHLQPAAEAGRAARGPQSLRRRVRRLHRCADGDRK